MVVLKLFLNTSNQTIKIYSSVKWLESFLVVSLCVELKDFYVKSLNVLNL